MADMGLLPLGRGAPPTDFCFLNDILKYLFCLVIYFIFFGCIGS